jgi:solute carrier family 25 aspartate/glutamate transporter 12/13
MATPRPPRSSLEAVFNKYASLEKDGKRFMSEADFVCDYLHLVPSDSEQEVISVYARAADTTGDSLISFEEFAAFESLLRRPDADSLLSFRLFDVQRRGIITFDNFQSTLTKTAGCREVPFDFESNFVKMYFGPKKGTPLDYFAFVQLLQNLPTEHARQAFVSKDSDRTGSIPALEFVDLVRKIRKHKLSGYVNDNLLAVMRGEGRRVNYAYFKAFNQLLNNVDLLEQIMTAATENGETPVTMEQVQMAAVPYPQVTPLQISLLFRILDSESNSGYVRMSDFGKLVPENRYALGSKQSLSGKATTTTTPLPTDSDRGVLSRILEGVYRFGLAGIGGATGATAVYPIDLVKTRMQNQRGSIAGEIMYNNSFDCARKVIRHEGFFGLYRGLLPQLMGVTPEKAIKLTVNDTVRDLLTNKDGELPLWKEIIAGGCVSCWFFSGVGVT